MAASDLLETDDEDAKYEADMVRLARLDVFADMVIALTEPLDDVRPDEFINDTRVRHTLHSMATLALHGQVLVGTVGVTSEPTE